MDVEYINRFRRERCCVNFFSERHFFGDCCWRSEYFRRCHRQTNIKNYINSLSQHYGVVYVSEWKCKYVRIYLGLWPTPNIPCSLDIPSQFTINYANTCQSLLHLTYNFTTVSMLHRSSVQATAIITSFKQFFVLHLYNLCLAAYGKSFSPYWHKILIDSQCYNK